MPNLDGTGPLGEGPRTGRNRGECNGGNGNTRNGNGAGRGRSRGKGQRQKRIGKQD